MKMDCGVVGRFVICVCFVGFTSAAKCVPEKCADMEVSYPFWFKDSRCGHPDFQIYCNKDEDNENMAPFFRAHKGTNRSNLTLAYLKILNIDYTGYLTVNSASLKAQTCDADTAVEIFELPRSSPFTVSASNKVVFVGCKRCAIYGYGHHDVGLDYWGIDRCVPHCKRGPSYCRKNGCCELNLQNNWKWVILNAGAKKCALTHIVDKETNLSAGDGRKVSCSLATILDPATLDNKTNLLPGDGRKVNYGLRLNWGIGDANNCSCSSKAKCVLNSPSGKGYVCHCLPGYEGNGYTNDTDCTDIDECSPKGSNDCVGAEGGGICINLAGSYNCSCAKGYEGDGFQNGTRCLSKSSSYLKFAIIGSASSFVVVSSSASLLVWWLKKRHMKLVEAKYFQQLQKYIASRVGRESLRMFSAKELARASNNYSNEMILGSGGFGTVYKGSLADCTLVAIKKSKEAFNLQDSNDFLNEVTILSQINHRNIVKLLGCCIQTEFPMLVSEFVPNRTLLEHLQSKEGCLPWVSRLHIAIETAEALAYLHSGASQPIFHWDVKSSNILLNETFSPKVADFGISRLITASNNTHVTASIIKGTRGYLDPEYIRTGQFNDKSDVYSFGVVLIELLTALKPLSIQRVSEELCLSDHFLSKLNHNRLIEILDSKVLEEENLEQMEDMARIASECLNLERRKRPSMKEVVEELLWVRGGTRQAKFHDNTEFEKTSVSREESEASRKFRSYTFPSIAESMSEEPFTALLQMSTMP